MLQKYINSKPKDSEIKAYALCLGNISKDFTISKYFSKNTNIDKALVSNKVSFGEKKAINTLLFTLLVQF